MDTSFLKISRLAYKQPHYKKVEKSKIQMQIEYATSWIRKKGKTLKWNNNKMIKVKKHSLKTVFAQKVKQRNKKKASSHLPEQENTIYRNIIIKS